MATITVDLNPEEAQFLGSAFPAFTKVNGSQFPVTGLKYDTTTAESAFWKFDPLGYPGSGNVTVSVLWYADTASTGVVVWDVQLAAITPNTDTQDVETKTMGTANTASDTHLGTTGQRLHSIDVTVTNLDSLTAGDMVWVKITRDTGDVNDTMAGDAILVQARLSYSDT